MRKNHCSQVQIATCQRTFRVQVQNVKDIRATPGNSLVSHIFATLYQLMDSCRQESCNLSIEGIFQQPPIKSWILAESLLCQAFKNAKNSVGIVHTVAKIYVNCFLATTHSKCHCCVTISKFWRSIGSILKLILAQFLKNWCCQSVKSIFIQLHHCNAPTQV